MRRSVFAVTVAIILSACGGADNSSPSTLQPDEDIPPTAIADGADSPDDNEQPGDNAAATGITLSDHLGSLYQRFSWAGPVRDPMRDELELQTAASYTPLTTSEKATLTDIASSGDIIAQIGGLGSAKIAPGATVASDLFTDYMDAMIADNGEAWRFAVRQRAAEVAEALSGDQRLYWQIGNEVNANSYTSNALLYFDNDTGSQSDTAFSMKVYAEYFLAPTIQGFIEAESDTGLDVRVALGSVSAFSAPTSQAFLNDLLNYEIEGAYAPALAGRQVHELIDLITIHYLAHSHNANDTEHWRNVLEDTFDQWVHNNIEGVWTTEEVGINVASGGAGAGAAMTVASRYLDWIITRQLSPRQSRWFYYGTTAGPDGQAITDSMTQFSTLLNDRTVSLLSTTVLESAIEIRTFALSDGELIVIISGLEDAEVALNDIDILLPSTGEQLELVTHSSAWLYRGSGTTQPSVSATITAETDNNHILTLHSLSGLTLSRLDALLIHIE